MKINNTTGHDVVIRTVFTTKIPEKYMKQCMTVASKQREISNMSPQHRNGKPKQS